MPDREYSWAELLSQLIAVACSWGVWQADFCDSGSFSRAMQLSRLRALFLGGSVLNLGQECSREKAYVLLTARQVKQHLHAAADAVFQQPLVCKTRLGEVNSSSDPGMPKQFWLELFG